MLGFLKVVSKSVCTICVISCVLCCIGHIMKHANNHSHLRAPGLISDPCSAGGDDLDKPDQKVDVELWDYRLKNSFQVQAWNVLPVYLFLDSNQSIWIVSVARFLNQHFCCNGFCRHALSAVLPALSAVPAFGACAWHNVTWLEGQGGTHTDLLTRHFSTCTDDF